MKRKIKDNPLEVDIGYLDFIIENCQDAKKLLTTVNYDYGEFMEDKRNAL